jgi:hypothetical protein
MAARELSGLARVLAPWGVPPVISSMLFGLCKQEERAVTKVIHAVCLSISLILLFTNVAQSQTLKAENAQLQDKFLVIKSVETPAAGWLVVHKSSGGKPGDIIGSMTVVSGTNSEVEILLAAALKPGAGVILMLHENSGASDKFDAAKDKPIMEGGKPVMAEVKVK